MRMSSVEYVDYSFWFEIGEESSVYKTFSKINEICKILTKQEYRINELSFTNYERNILSAYLTGCLIGNRGDGIHIEIHSENERYIRLDIRVSEYNRDSSLEVIRILSPISVKREETIHYYPAGWFDEFKEQLDSLGVKL